MHVYQRIWHYFQRHRAISIVVGHVSVVAILGMLLLGNALGTGLFGVFGAFAKAPCSSGDRVYVVASGDTLGVIAAHYNVNLRRLASYNHIANPNLIYVHQTICIPKSARPAPPPPSPPPVKGTGNYFPYGECTWYANKRYHELHRIYVPWTTNSNAWQWKYRASDFHWQISARPSVGAIIDLQPWVQGAYSQGHVAVVEKILRNGHVIVSSMNWGAYYWKVTYKEFSAGPGVTFITY
jgi:surface antigen